MQPLDPSFENEIAPRLSPGSSATLTSWKEIAQYLGKGVRTVQRWEQNLHLPVRRPDGQAKGIVRAVPNEIDLWLQSRFTPNGENSKSELDRLRERIAELLAENQSLRRELEQERNTARATRIVREHSHDENQ